MTFNQLLNAKAALERLAEVENSFGASLALNRLLSKAADLSKVFEVTLKPYQERARALGTDEKAKLDAINAEVGVELEKVVEGAEGAFKGLELKLEDWAEKEIKASVIRPLVDLGLIAY